MNLRLPEYKPVMLTVLQHLDNKLQAQNSYNGINKMKLLTHSLVLMAIVQYSSLTFIVHE